MIGATYKYPEHKQLFKLKEKRAITYVFECGHWVTDCVFKDMILVSSQTSLF